MKVGSVVILSANSIQSLPEHAPQDVKDACDRVLAFIEAGMQPALDLIQYVQSWLAKEQAQNQWGK